MRKPAEPIKCAYRHCRETFTPRGQKRFHSKRCQDAHNYEQSRTAKTLRKKRLCPVKPVEAPYSRGIISDTGRPPIAEKGQISPMKTVSCKRHVEAKPLQYETPQRNGLPQGPPPPLSAVEIACLGGHVVTVKPRQYVPRIVPVVDDASAGPTAGALQGDDYPLDYYDDGFPKLPDCLRRREPRLDVAA